MQTDDGDDNINNNKFKTVEYNSQTNSISMRTNRDLESNNSSGESIFELKLKEIVSKN